MVMDVYGILFQDLDDCRAYQNGDIEAPANAAPY